MGFERAKTVCFTGVKPEKLPEGGSRTSKRIRVLKRIIHDEIRAAINEGYEIFMTGMQPGTALWAGEAVLELRNRYPVKLVAVIPCKGFGAEYSGDVLWAFSRIMSEADGVVTVCRDNIKGCGRMRDMFMVQQSARIIGVAGEGHERTDAFRTIKYAAKMGLDIIRIDPGIMFYEAEKHLDKSDPRHVLFNDYDPDKMRKDRGVERISGRNFTVVGNARAEYGVMEISPEEAERFTEIPKKNISAGDVTERSEGVADVKPKETGSRSSRKGEIPAVTDSKAYAARCGGEAGKACDSRKNVTVKISPKAVKNNAVDPAAMPQGKSMKTSAEKKTLKITVPKRPDREPVEVRLEDIIDERYSAVVDDLPELE